MNISLAFLQNVQCNHFATGPVSKPRSKISRVVRTERPAPTHTCWVSSLKPAFCPSRRTPPLGRSFVKSCCDLIWQVEGCRIRCFTEEMLMPSRLRRPPEVGAGAQRRAPLWCVALCRQILHPVRRAAPSLADLGPAPPCCPSNMAKTKLQIRLGASTHGSAAACSAQGALPTPVGPLSRLVPLPPALFTPYHGPICAGIWSTPRATGLGSAPLVARLIAVGAEARAGCVQPSRPLYSATCPALAQHARPTPARRETREHPKQNFSLTPSTPQYRWGLYPSVACSSLGPTGLASYGHIVSCVPRLARDGGLRDGIARHGRGL